MNEEVGNNISGLLRRLLESYIDYPADLRIEYRPFVGRVDWRINANINDQGKLIGKQGAHIKAVQFLMEEIGEQHQEIFVVRLEEPSGIRQRDIGRVPANPAYNCTDHKNLILDLLREVLVDEVEVNVLREREVVSRMPSFTFQILAKTIADYETLVVPVEGGDNLTIVACLGTLFRAAGHRDGVTFKIEVPSR